MIRKIDQKWKRAEYDRLKHESNITLHVIKEGEQTY